jgi:hypothetical protein
MIVVRSVCVCVSSLVPHSTPRPEPRALRPPQNGRMLRPPWTQGWTQHHFSTNTGRIEVIEGVLESPEYHGHKSDVALGGLTNSGRTKTAQPRPPDASTSNI